MNSWRSLARIFYRPRDVLASNWEKRKWAYIFLLVFALSYGDTIISFRVTTGILEATPSVVFFYSLCLVLTIWILINALYLRVVSAILGLELKLDHWLGFVTWSNVPSSVFVLGMTIVLSGALFLSSDALGRESSVLMNVIKGSRFWYPSVNSFYQYRFIADVWVVGVQTIGFSALSGKRPLICFVIVIVPLILAHMLIRWFVF